MATREKLDEFAELRGWNKNKPIGWSEAADFADWLVKNCPIPDVGNSAEYTHGYKDGWRDCCKDVMTMLPSSETIEANGMEGGLRDGELQMFWEGAEWLKNYLQKRLLSKGNAVLPTTADAIRRQG